jgi:ATP-dependent DNA helicase RecG
MSDNNHITNPREFMELAVETMRSSISEIRSDKRSPSVGAVLVMADGRVEKACRGELSFGDHAEYTLLERKLVSENLTGAVLFVTLEPCAPGARSGTKTSCAERIVSRRISKVWVGIEDPDPLVDNRGIQYLQDNGVEVELFDRDLQEIIRQSNMDFIESAEERAAKFPDEPIEEILSDLEKPILSATLEELNQEEINAFLENAGEFRFAFGSDEFIRIFSQMRYLTKTNDGIHPTGLGILLFGDNPQVFFPHAVIRATFRMAGKKEDIETFNGSLSKQAKKSIKWFKRIIGKQIDRTDAERKEVYNYPEDVVRESINNALAHRSYDIEGASVHLEIFDDSIVIRSPGGPVKPISMERIQRLDAPYLSKNPRITYVFEKLRLSESRGLGFETIRGLPTEHKLPLPIATFDYPYLTFTFSREYGNGVGDERLSTLSGSEAKGYDYIRLNSPVTRRAYEENLDLSQKTAGRHMAHFVELNLIKKVGSGTKTAYEVIH